MHAHLKFMSKFAPVLVASIAALTLSSSIVAQDHTHTAEGEDRPELTTESVVPLNPAAGSEIGLVFESFLSPQQESGEEADTPIYIPPQFRSTAPSVDRDQRTSRGHGVIEFTKDLSKAYVYLAVENVNVDDVVMLHLHCGLPAQLGPIIVDFSIAGDLKTYLADGVMQVEITNHDIEAVLNSVSGPVDAFTLGCPIASGTSDEVKTIAGLSKIAERGELYFNLHTAGQVYFGDMRGQFYPVAKP